MSEWKPIETAPKDGTKVDLILISNSEDSIKIWRKPDCTWMTNNQHERHFRAYSDYISVPEAGWMFLGRDPDEPCKETGMWVEEYGTATHWLSFPSPPPIME